MTIDSVQAQYEALPYPERRPSEERKRLITGSPSHLDELSHHLFGGSLPASRPFRVLVAGGGTGDALIMLAQQCADQGIDAVFTYLDMSSAARRVAEGRARERGLQDRIRFLTGSLLDPPAEITDPFDYIDCCGVLHHLESPEAGLQQLERLLAPGGGMGLMVYAPYGRTGVYALQSALRRLGHDHTDHQPAIGTARRLLKALPESNWFRRNPYLGDHNRSDAGLYDLLLHSRDRPYTVEALNALVGSAGLAIAAFIHPAAYRLATHVADPQILRRAEGLDPVAEAALAEELSGAMNVHVVYVCRPADRTANPTPADTHLVPVLRDLDARKVARELKPGLGANVTVNNVRLKLPLPRLAAAILNRIDGSSSIDRLFERIALDQPESVTREMFDEQMAEFITRLNGVGRLYLRALPGRPD